MTDRLPLEGLTIDADPDRRGERAVYWPDGTLTSWVIGPPALKHGVTTPDPPAPEPERRLIAFGQLDGNSVLWDTVPAVRSAGDLRPGDVVAGYTVERVEYGLHGGPRKVTYTEGSSSYYPPGTPVVLDKVAES